MGWVVFIVGSLLAFPFVLTLALDQSVSRDEHQHIAAGILFAQDGLLPYRDFAYFNLPYLVYAYGLLFQATDHFLLAARFFSALCAALTCGAVAGATWQLFPARPPWQRMAIAGGGMVLLMSAPLFTDTVAHSWNQEPSVLLALLSFLCHNSALRCARPGGRLFVSGILLGLAIGMRVTFAPLVLPFAIMVWLQAASAPERLRRLLLFGGGIALALLPALWAFVAAPAGFVFGNVEFPKLNVVYRYASGEPQMMTLLTKLRFFFKSVMCPNWMLFFGFCAAWLGTWICTRFWSHSWPRFFGFLALILPFLFLGSIAPSPAFDQYFYPFLPFLVLGIASLFAAFPVGAPRLRGIWGAAAALALIAPMLTGDAYEDLGNLSSPPKWRPSLWRADAAKLRQLVPAGRVLTLAPISPLEAGLEIYPELVTGPFAWRIAPFVPQDRRALLHLMAPEDLEARLEAEPPAAIITGYDDKWEDPIIQYATAKGYRPRLFLKNKKIWLAPSSDTPQPGSSRQPIGSFQ